MPIQVLMPALSPTMTEGNLAKWIKKEGDKITPGTVIAEIETDKATMEVEATDEGVLAKIIIPEGTEGVKVNALIALILEEGESEADLANFAAPAPTHEAVPAAQPKVEKTPETLVSNASAKQEGTRIFASPLAKRIAEQNNVDLSNVSGSGPRGRIVKADVEGAPSSSSAPKLLPVFLGRNPEESYKIPNNNMRKVIAKRLLESKQTVPHFYLSIECKIDKLLKTREDMNHATDKENPAYKLSVNDFVIKAVAMALRDVPEANSSWTDDAVIRYNNVDISIAVAIDGGLITPIIRNADQKSISHLSNEMKQLAVRAKKNELKPEEFQGGSFTISNLGMFGIKKFEAIINPPQSCILAIGASSKRPVVVGDEIKIAHVMDVSLSCDHRVVDGAVGANFLAAFKKYIESPVLMFV